MRILVLLHILGAIIFIGNIITAAFWKMKADKTQDQVIIHTTVKNILFADKIFTNPSIILLIGTGIILGIHGPYSMTEWNWLTLSLLLFIIMGILFIAILSPIQKRLILFSNKKHIKENGWDSYLVASKQWAIFGSLLTIIPLIILYLMTVKPF